LGIFFKNCGIFLTVNLSVYKKNIFLKQTNTVVFIFSKNNNLGNSKKMKISLRTLKAEKHAMYS
jgi:hypothetical protein